MSTRGTIRLYGPLHIYHECLDDHYWAEVNFGRWFGEWRTIKLRLWRANILRY
jgi:hypothetical protein